LGGLTGGRDSHAVQKKTLERANQVVTCPAARDLKKRQLDDTLEHSLFAAANTR